MKKTLLGILFFLFYSSILLGCNPTLIGHVETEGPKRISFSNNYAFIVDPFDLKIIDISNPQKPEIIKTIDEVATDIAIKDNYLFLIRIGGDLIIYNISNINNPKKISEINFNLDNYITRISISKNYVFLFNNEISGMPINILDISNILKPKAINSIETNYQINAIFIKDNYAYIARDKGGIEILDISNILDIKKIGSIDTKKALDIYVKNNFAYVADGDELKIINVSIPSQPEIISEVKSPDSSLWYYFNHISIYDDYAFITGGAGNLLIINISNPYQPKYIISIDNLVASYSIIKNNLLYIIGGMESDDAGLKILDISNCSSSNSDNNISNEDTTTSNNDYQKGFVDGKNYCKEHPVECGIDFSKDLTTGVSTFNTETNILYIPNLFIGMDFYELSLQLLNSNAGNFCFKITTIKKNTRGY